MVLLACLAGCSTPPAPEPTQVPPTATPEPLPIAEQVKQNGVVRCGVYVDYPGFAYINDDGAYSGLDTDICRALAAALFDDPNAVHFDGFVMADPIANLKNHTVDIVFHTARPQLGIEDGAIGYARSVYQSGAGLLVNADYTSWNSLHNVPTCALPGADYEAVLDPLFVAENDQDLDLEYVDLWTTLYGRYNSGDCKALVLPRPMLIEAHRAMTDPAASKILPLNFFPQAIGPLISTSDSNWIATVNAVIGCLQQLDDTATAEEIGLPANYCDQIHAHLGTYTQIYDRNLGKETPNFLPLAE